MNAMNVTREQVESAEKNLVWLRQQQGMNQASPGALCSPTKCEPPRRPQVLEELEELGYAIDSLEKAISCLHDRMSMVTRPQPTCPTGEEAETPRVQIASIINGYRKKVRVLRRYITNLTDTLEV